MASTGYPGKREGIGGVNEEQLLFESEAAATAAVTEHELDDDPHSQYTTEEEVNTIVLPLIPRFVTFWKWS